MAGINFPSGFNVTTNLPIDIRLVKTCAEMRSVIDDKMPSYYLVICADGDDKGRLFLYDKNATADPTYGKYRKISYNDLMDTPNIPEMAKLVGIYATTGDASQKKTAIIADITEKGSASTYINKQMLVLASTASEHTNEIEVTTFVATSPYYQTIYIGGGSDVSIINDWEQASTTNAPSGSLAKGSIDTLQTEIDGVGVGLADLTEEVGDVKLRLANAEGDIQAHTGLIEGLTTTVNTHSTSIQELSTTKYTKPTTGIPETDLSVDVQTKLNKVQEQADWTETDVNKASFIKNKPAIPEATTVTQTATEIKINSTTLNSASSTQIGLLSADDYKAFGKKLDSDAIINSFSTQPATNKALSEALTKLELEKKTDKTFAIPKWDGSAIYNAGSAVISGTTIYISLSDGNTGHAVTETTYWTPVSGGGSGQKEFVTKFGEGGEKTEYTINHNLNTRNFVYTLRQVGFKEGETGYSSRIVDAEIEIIDANNIKVILSAPIQVNRLCISMIACYDDGSPENILVDRYETPLPEWEIDNPTNKPILVQTFDANGKMIVGDVVPAPDSNASYGSMTVDFLEPSAGSVVFATGMSFTFTEQQHISIPKSDEKWYVIQAYDDTLGLMVADIEQGYNSIEIDFDKPHTGGYIQIEATPYVVDNLTEEVIYHNLGRMPLVQVYREGYGLAEVMVVADKEKVTITSNIQFTAYIVIA